MMFCLVQIDNLQFPNKGAVSIFAMRDDQYRLLRFTQMKEGFETDTEVGFEQEE